MKWSRDSIEIINRHSSGGEGDTLHRHRMNAYLANMKRVHNVTRLHKHTKR